MGSTSIDSKIITNKHIGLISKWINEIDPRDELKIPHEFELLYRGSRDGFTNKRFHEICDNRPHTLTIIKVKNSKEILGGYNPITWQDGGCNSYNSFSTNKSFIFSF